jgi:hypothetical protein
MVTAVRNGAQINATPGLERPHGINGRHAPAQGEVLPNDRVDDGE